MDACPDGPPPLCMGPLRRGQKWFEDARATYKEGKTVGRIYKDTASLKAKGMIVNGLIRGVEVYWDYKLRMDFTQFCLELNVVASAAQNKKLVSERKRVFCFTLL